MWWGRLVIAGAAASTAAIVPALRGAAAAQTVPETVIVTPPPCVYGAADGSRRLSFECLNGRLDTQSGAQSPNFKAANATDRGNPEQVGTFSFTATAIRMGNAFGQSALPQRPIPPGFANPLPPGGK